MVRFILILLCFSALPVFALEHAVVKSETLSKLCGRLVAGPVWGRDGSLKVVVALNPWIKDIHMVYPGQVITFPDENGEVAAVAPYAAPPIVPVVVQAPAAEPVIVKLASEEKPEWAPSSRIYTLAGMEYFQISSQDKATRKHGDFASNTSPRLDLIWEVDWSREYKSRIFFSHVSESIMNDSTAGRTLNKATGARNNFGLEILKKFTESTSAGLYASRSTRSFLRASDQTTLQVDRISGFELGLRLEKDLLQVSKLKLSAFASGGWLAPTQGVGYSVGSGSTAKVGLALRHELRAVTLEAQTYYGYWQQDSKYSKQTSSQVGMTVGASWRFDE